MGRGRKKHNEIPRILEENDTLPEAVKQYIIDQNELNNKLTKTMVELQVVILSLQKEIQELKKQGDKDSHNSHKPPSTDDPYKKPNRTKSTRKKSGKKPGGRKGHTGTCLQQVANPDTIELLGTKEECDCGKDLSDALVLEHSVRQVFDIILPKVSVTEVRGEIKQCACGKIHEPEFPDGVKMKAQYGSTIKSFCVYLKHYGMMSYERIAELCSDMFGLQLSQGTIVNFINECPQGFDRPGGGERHESECRV